MIRIQTVRVPFIVILILITFMMKSETRLNNLTEVTKESAASNGNKASSGSKDSRHSSCIERRGLSGRWVPSPGYDYNPTTPKSEFLNHTKWTWQDDATNCQMEPITPRGICDAMYRLDYERLFFVGDSLSYQMVQSLWGILVGKLEVPGDQFQPFSRPFNCVSHLGGKDFQFELEFVRNDNLGNITEKVEVWTKVGHHKYFPWMIPFVTKPMRTILIANMGMHTPNEDAFRQEFGSFLQTLELTNRLDNLIVYRTSVPGHGNCMEYKQPLANARNFDEVELLFNWPLVEGFNRYARERIKNITSKDGGILSVFDTRWMLLDVYPSTILRADGHRNSRDCLHYQIPGPTDFWVHFFYSNLLSMLNE